MRKAIFISHSSRDSDFVNKLRDLLEAKGIFHLIASRELRGNEENVRPIFEAIENARAFIVIISPDAFNSAWVAEETRHASQVKEKRQGMCAMIPLLREGVELGALKWIFMDKPLAIRVGRGPAGLKKALPMIIRALGGQPEAASGPESPASSGGGPESPASSGSGLESQTSSGSGPESPASSGGGPESLASSGGPATAAPAETGHRQTSEAPPALPRAAAVRREIFAELLLEMRAPFLEERDGVRRAAATAELSFIPPHAAPAGVVGCECREPFLFTAPVGPAQIDEIKWYLEQYYLWPTGEQRSRAKQVEEMLPQWGRALKDHAMPDDACADVLAAWAALDPSVSRRFTIFIDSQLVRGSAPGKQKEAYRAAMLLMAQPWELLHDGRVYLFQGAESIRARRQLPPRRPRDLLTVKPAIRILLVSAEAEDKGLFPEARSAAMAVDPIDTAGEYAEIALLSPPTLPALQEELDQARRAEIPYHVIHLDGHGVYKRGAGPTAICFEAGGVSDPAGRRGAWDLHAERLAETLETHRLHLFFSRSLAIRRR